MANAVESSSPEYLIKLGEETIDQAKQEGIILRLMGGCAFRVHTITLTDLHKRLARKTVSGNEIGDLDFMTYGKWRGKMQKFFERNGCKPDRDAQLAAGGAIWSERHIYHDKFGKCHMDVFFDKLEMCHTIDFKNRLEVDYPTIPLAELLLQKLEIVKIDQKDLKDMALLLFSHEIGPNDAETINGDYIAKLLANDWGFWYTTNMNLQKLNNNLSGMSLTQDETAIVSKRIEQLKQRIEQEPKSKSWMKRATVGASKKWYNDVDEVLTF